MFDPFIGGRRGEWTGLAEFRIPNCGTSDHGGQRQPYEWESRQYEQFDCDDSNHNRGRAAYSWRPGDRRGVSSSICAIRWRKRPPRRHPDHCDECRWLQSNTQRQQSRCWRRWFLTNSCSIDNSSIESPNKKGQLPKKLARESSVGLLLTETSVERRADSTEETCSV